MTRHTHSSSDRHTEQIDLKSIMEWQITDYFPDETNVTSEIDD